MSASCSDQHRPSRQDLEAACSLCSEARCSAEDARYMHEESVTLAQIVLESHAILADYDASLETEA